MIPSSPARTFTGPIFYRALTGRRIPRAFVDRLVADVLEQHVREAAEHRSAQVGGAGPA